jgi:hypothetical protein
MEYSREDKRLMRETIHWKFAGSAEAEYYTIDA